MEDNCGTLNHLLGENVLKHPPFLTDTSATGVDRVVNVFFLRLLVRFKLSSFEDEDRKKNTLLLVIREWL